MSAVFLSYAGSNRAVAARVVTGLRGSGVDVWWDQDGIGWGDNWLDKLQEKLQACAAYVLLVGPEGVRRWVKAELGVAYRRHVEQGLPLYPLLLDGVAPDRLPPFLGEIQVRTLPPDLESFDWGPLAAALGIGGEEAEAAGAVEPGEPFPGLLPYEETDARFFFGRQQETLALLQQLGMGLDGLHRRWLQVDGPSGVGKSSVVRAGLVPAVRRGWIGEEAGRPGVDWAVVTIRPGRNPLENLAAALERTLPGAGVERYEAVRRGEDSDALAYLLKLVRPSPGRLLLVVDQLEEIFTLTRDERTRERFDAQLAAALCDPDTPLYLTTTIRSDFLLRFVALPRLHALRNRFAGHYSLGPVSEAGLREVVRLPAARAGLKWDDSRLPEEIIEEALAAREAALPLAANLLRLLWDRSNARRDCRLLRADYEALGGVAGALARGADGLLDSLGADGKERARRLLLALVHVGEGSEPTRRTITRAQALHAAGGGALGEQVLNRLSGQRAAIDQGVFPRLVTVSGHEPATIAPGVPAESAGVSGKLDTVDLVHETLLRSNRRKEPYWPTLSRWVAGYRRQIEDGQLLEALAKAWDKARRPRWRDLATGGQLRAFGGALAPSDTARDYLRASRRRRRKVALFVSLLTILGAVGVQSKLPWARAVPDLAVAWSRAALGLPVMPEIERLPRDEFWMGSQPGQDDMSERQEQPRQKVRVDGPVGLGKYEVTFAEYDVFVFAAADDPETPPKCRALPNDQGWGRGRMPVVDVSWICAKEYARWLREQTNKRYRLPTEAEWEYAARAKQETRYWWGDDVGEGHANCDGCGSRWDGKQPAPVGSFKPNPFGLHDTAGNVWEWVEDCWHESYDGAPNDGSAWLEANAGDCGLRVLRGGSWYFSPQRVRSAYRDSIEPDNAYGGVIGFRLAEDLDL